MGKAKAPPAPDYTGAAQATAAGNLEAARATAAANKVNQVTPYGNLTYTTNPIFDESGYNQALTKYNALTAKQKKTALTPNRQAYTNENWTATQVYSPEQQAIYDQESKLNAGLLNTANSGLDYANQVLSKPGVDLTKLPGLASSAGTPATGMKSNIDPYGSIQNQIDTTGLPSYGINPGETYSDAIMRRLQPQMAQQSASEESRLANQGIGLGSNAYKSAKDIFNQQQNDLRTSAQIQGMQTGLQANQQQFGQNAAQQQAINAAQAQGFGQNATQAQLANQVNQQQFNQGLQNAQLQNDARQQGFTQEAYNQMQPINVINALSTGSQVQNPSYANVPQQANTAGADILGATQAGYNAQLGAVNAKNAASGNMMGGLMSMGGTLGGASIMA